MKKKLLLAVAGIIILMSFRLPADDVIQILTKGLEQFKRETPQVKLFLFFNQPIYMPGDTAYFSARFLTEDMIPVSGRQIIRVELVDNEGRIVFFENVSVKDGTGANQVAIPARLKAGIYSWVAYSDWMKNFDSSLYYKRDFLIVEENDLIPREKDNDHLISFFPEGGKLVADVSNRIVISGLYGLKSQRIVDEEGVQVADCIINNAGYGYSIIKPASMRRYYLLGSYKDRELRIQLPSADYEGISMQLFLQQSPARIELRRPNNSKLQSDNLWMVISARSAIYFKVPVKFDNKELLSVQFDQNELPSGICYATIFNDRGEVVAERMFSANKRNELIVELNKDKSVYNSREQVNLKLNLKNKLGNPVSGEFSVSVLNKKFSNDFAGPVSISNYLLSDTDIGTAVNDLSTEELDLFLITRKNIRMHWDKIIKGNFPSRHSFKRLIQYSGHAYNKDSGQPVPDSSRIVAYLQKNMMGYEAITRKDGSFDLAFLFDFPNEDEIFYTVENKRGKEINAQIKWEIDSVSPIKPELEMKNTGLPNAYAGYQSRNQFINRSYSFYKSSDELDKLSDVLDPNLDFEDELSGADFTVKVDDYVVFPTMEELIREVIPSLQHRKVKGKSQVKVVLPDGALPPDGPLYMIDGVMTRDTDYFLQLKPNDVITVKVVRAYNKLTRMGTLARNGIVLVHTKGMDHKSLLLENTILPVKGVNKTLTFKLRSHTDSNLTRIPDFRATLYWNPAIKIDASGYAQINFPTSDDIGNYLIRIQGITTDGKPFEKLDSLRVQFNRN